LTAQLAVQGDPQFNTANARKAMHRRGPINRTSILNVAASRTRETRQRAAAARHDRWELSDGA
jgi:hypothetical protein